MTRSEAGPRRSSKALPKAKLAPKKVMVTVWWSAACLIHNHFLNPSETIASEKYAQQIDEMQRKTATPAAGIGLEKTQFSSTTILNLMSHNQHFKSLMNWATEVFLILHVHLTSRQLTSTSSGMLTTF